MVSFKSRAAFVAAFVLASCTRTAPVTEHVEAPLTAYEVVAAFREDGFVALPAQTELVVPERLQVLQGTSGRHPIAVMFDGTLCRYRGVPEGTSYEFVSCHDRMGARIDLRPGEPVFTQDSIKVRVEGETQAQVRAVIQVVI
jgi:hypothetical protein